MSHTLPDIDFASIRLLRGNQRDGFEELTVQLFCGETEGTGEFFRIEGSGGDGGVEAYREQPGGQKIGFQAKYIDSFRGNQWGNITNSVKTAMKNHPELIRYIIAAPIDRSPAQIKRWKTLKAEWQDHAKTLGIKHTIKFEWWGNSKLIGLLSEERYRNQLVYWFGVPEFSQDWLHAFNHSSITLLGKRYSPKQHIETETGARLEAFAWSEDGKHRIIDVFVKVAEQWSKIDHSALAKAEGEDETKDLTKVLRHALNQISGFRWPDSGYPAIRPLYLCCREALEGCRELAWKLRQLNRAAIEKKAARKDSKAHCETGPFDPLVRKLDQLADILGELCAATDFCQSADDQKLLLHGEAGSGKSHLIADLVTAAKGRSQPVLLLLGERYLEAGDPWQATVKLLGWEYTPDDLLAALDQEALLTGRPALVCIDALNESEHRKFWKSHLIHFADRASRYSRVKILVSCRSDFLQITVPESVLPGKESSWYSLIHRGYGEEVIEAIQIYFEASNVQASHFPPALSEFRNPLFLKIFCEAFEGQPLPTGPIGLDKVMNARIARLGEQIEEEINCDPEDTRDALHAIAGEIAKNGGKPLPRRQTKKITLEYFPNRDASSSLYARLLSNGILVETLRPALDADSEPEVFVRFSFERFSDYFIARQMLEGVDTVARLHALFEPDGKLVFLKDLGEYYSNRGVARAIAILIPERLQVELADILKEVTDLEVVLEDFLESLAWRSAASITPASEVLLDRAMEMGLDVLPVFLRIATIPAHPYNSEFLGKRLLAMTLPERELEWTIPISELSSWDEKASLDEFLDWCFRAPKHLVSDEQALLAARLLLWFCTSNNRALRRRATLAAIKLLVGRSDVVCDLVSEFHAVDDPYLIERLYAVTAGVAMRLPSGTGLSNLASAVYRSVFSEESVSANILIRDFAGSVLECSLAKGCLPKNISPESFRPPFLSQWPSILSEDEVKRFEENEKWFWIVDSVRTEGMGNYGDFGRYVMEARVHNFSDKPLSEDAPDSDYRERFSGMVARRWVLQRVEELGWTAELFGEYEKHLPHGRCNHDAEENKVERISKKYQWIALRELLGFLSDHYWLDRAWQPEPVTFSGAWQVSAREFDPSQRLLNLEENDATAGSSGRSWEEAYPDPFKDKGLCKDREAWVMAAPGDFSSLLQLRPNSDDSNEVWLALAGHHEWVEPDYDRVISRLPGKLQMWINVRSYLVNSADLDSFVEEIQKKHFWGNFCDFIEEHAGWIGEYPWGEVYRDLREWCEEPDRWIGEVAMPYTSTACNWSEGGILIPSPQMCDLLDIRWVGEGGTFQNREGREVTDYFGGEIRDWSHPLIVRKVALDEQLEANDLSLVWCVLAERSCWCSDSCTHPVLKELQVSAVYWLSGNELKGGSTQEVTQKLYR